MTFRSICKIIEARVLTNPEAIALKAKGLELTYEKLNEKAEILARYLRSKGLTNGKVVGLSLEKNIDLIVGILAILKAGGVYFPLDPNYPRERLKYMMEDAQPALLLTQSDLLDQLPSYGSETLCIDHEIPQVDCELDGKIDRDQLAYLIYTSGSTGKPKGIMIRHESLPELVFARKGLYPEKPISLLTGSISFDPSIVIIFYTLSCGGTLCLQNQEVVDPKETANLILKQEINFVLAVPSFYEMLLDKADELPSLECVVLAGEALPSFLPPLHARISPNALLYNEYGPSEYAVGGTIATIYDPSEKTIHKITIGRPLSNAKIYILDDELKPVQKGDKGEIFVGGSGLAKGYLNRPELTSEKFIWISSLEKEPVRLYRTGDFGRFLENGEIEFLGRMDHQVKIRGYRIELGEIEHVLLQFPEIGEVAVVTEEHMMQGKQLAAYFTSSVAISTDELRAYLKITLPHYMIPTHFYQLQEFPRTPNGKIDRNALGMTVEPETKQKTQPQSEIEAQLLKIWIQVLQHETIGMEDNFFDIGGNSLLIGKVQTLLNQEHQLDIPMIALFQYPTIYQFAEHLNTAQKNTVSNHSQQIFDKRKAAFQRLKKQHLK